LDVRAAREALNLSQAEAARRAGVSLATWRRGEADISAVGARTRKKIREVLTAASQPVHSWVPLFNTRFRGDPLTPAEAHMLATELTMNGESFHLDVDSVWDSHILGELPDAVLMQVAERPQWLRRFLATSQILGGHLDKGRLPRAENLAEAAALRIALTSPSLEELSDVSGLGYQKYERDLPGRRNWPRVRRALTPPQLIQALRMLEAPGYAAHLLAPLQINGRLVTSPLHPDRWWEPWSHETQEWLHQAVTSTHPSPRQSAPSAFTDDNPDQARTMASGIFELLAEREADLDLLLNGLLQQGRVAQIDEDSRSTTVLEDRAGRDVLIRVSCRDRHRSEKQLPSFPNNDPIGSATFAWGLLDLLSDEMSELDEVFEGDLIRSDLAVAEGSVLVLPDASGFDLLLTVGVQERTPERSAAVDTARASWMDYKRELEEEFAAWDAQDDQG
jgi:transcriptional regulator with XRE-family HTH domain